MVIRQEREEIWDSAKEIKSSVSASWKYESGVWERECGRLESQTNKVLERRKGFQLEQMILLDQVK